MKKRSLSIIFILCILNACNQVPENTEASTLEINKENKSEFWNSIINNFPFSGISSYDFSTDGTPQNQVENLPKIEPKLFKILTEQIKEYQNWKDYLEIYYFSKNTLNQNEMGIFLRKKEFDGTSYYFDLIQFDKSGNVIHFQNIANTWEAAECFGYTSAIIDNKSKTITTNKIQKCFDEETESFMLADSIVSENSFEFLSIKK